MYERSGQANSLLIINTLHVFALPILMPTFGIICWTIQETENLDIITRKILNMTENFHRNSDIDRLYLPRKMGGRRLKSIKLAYKCHFYPSTLT